MSNHNSFAFIVGHYKSGSTWLAHMLALHEEIRVVSETHVFRYTLERESLRLATEELFTESAWGNGGIKKFPRYWLSKYTRPLRASLGMARGTASLVANHVPTTMQDIGLYNQLALRKKLDATEDARTYCRTFFSDLLQNLNPGRYLLEKTPTNIYYIDAIRDCFPDAKLLAIYRDGRDVVVSDKHHLKRAYGTQKSFEERVESWVNAMKTQIELSEKHGIHCLSYEDLQHSTYDSLCGVLDHLELPTNPADMTRMIANSSFEAMSGGRQAGEADATKFHRKGIVGDWRNEFSDAETELFSRIAGPLLVQLGYETSESCANWS